MGWGLTGLDLRLPVQGGAGPDALAFSGEVFICAFALLLILFGHRHLEGDDAGAEGFTADTDSDSDSLFNAFRSPARTSVHTCIYVSKKNANTVSYIFNMQQHSNRYSKRKRIQQFSHNNSRNHLQAQFQRYRRSKIWHFSSSVYFITKIKSLINTFS